MDTRLPQLLAPRLTAPLPGPLVGSRFEPKPRYGRHYDKPPPGARQAAVLVLLYPYQNQWHIPFTLRPAHLLDHAGQVSFPGGALEPDEAGDRAAIREFHEELGATDHQIQLLGHLSPLYVHASNFHITPWVGVTWQRPRWSVNVAEVEQLLEVPLSHLLDPGSIGSHQRHYQGSPYTAPHFKWQSHRIWGATCMILGELITVLEGLPSEDRSSAR